MRYVIEQSIEIEASANEVWNQIVDLDIASFKHPAVFRLLDIPKPLNAELTKSGLGGVRTAYFAGGKQFRQEIVRWEPPHAEEQLSHFDFTFHACEGFRVGYFLDLHSDPFQMKAGAYRIEHLENGVRLYLSSDYELTGWAGACLRIPVRLTLYFFQAYLLRGIRRNAGIQP